MAKAEASVEELVSMIERGELRLPEMQRRYVWRATRVRDLMDSLYRGYPTGGILLWETDEPIPEQDFAVSQAKNPYPSTRLLLDGQQRLTSLAAVLRGESLIVRGRKKPIALLFNLEHPDQSGLVSEVDEEGNGDDDEEEEDTLVVDDPDATEDDLQQRFERMTFVVATNKLAAQPNWVSVSQVFQTDQDAPFLAKAGIERIDDPKYAKYSGRLAKLRAIRNYVYRMDVLERNLSYDQVTDIFVRVNSLGAKLRGSDLALAQITAKWRNSLVIFDAERERFASSGYDLDLSTYLKNMIAFATGQSRFLTVNSLTKHDLESAWKTSCEGMDFAMNFVKNNAGIDSPALLASPFLLVTLAFFGHKRQYRLSAEDNETLRFWALLANAKARYSRGSSESLLDQDLAIIRDGGGGNELVDRLRQQVGRLSVTGDELEGRNQRSALFKTMFLAFRDAGAKDWQSQLSIALDHGGATHRLQFHHIFPKALLHATFSSREADDIANLAFIAGNTNRRISAKPPTTYISKLVDEGHKPDFDDQCIPTDPALLDVAKYKDFLVERRTRIAKRLNEFLGTDSSST